MKERLGMTAEQSLKMDKAKEEMKSKLSALKENKLISNDQKMEQYKELKEQQKEKMKSILTEDQWKQLKERKHGRKSVKKTVT